MDPMAGGGRGLKLRYNLYHLNCSNNPLVPLGAFCWKQDFLKTRSGKMKSISVLSPEWMSSVLQQLFFSIIWELTSSSLSLSQFLLSHCLLLSAQATQTMRAEKTSNKPLGKDWFSPQKLFQAPTLLLHLNICKSFTAAQDNNLITVPLKFYATTAR